MNIFAPSFSIPPIEIEMTSLLVGRSTFQEIDEFPFRKWWPIWPLQKFLSFFDYLRFLTRSWLISQSELVYDWRPNDAWMVKMVLFGGITKKAYTYKHRYYNVLY
jgi:hypothetical protein